MKTIIAQENDYLYFFMVMVSLFFSELFYCFSGEVEEPLNFEQIKREAAGDISLLRRFKFHPCKIAWFNKLGLERLC